jgi:hypothetical protein
MPMETLDIGDGQDPGGRWRRAVRSRLARVLRPTTHRRRVAWSVTGVGLVTGALLAWTLAAPTPQVGQPTADAPTVAGLRRAEPEEGLRHLRPPPWVTRRAPTTSVMFVLVNRSERRVRISTPPRFVFTVAPNDRVRFARRPVCGYQRFTASFPTGPPIGTLRHFCQARRWVVLPSGQTRLR